MARKTMVSPGVLKACEGRKKYRYVVKVIEEVEYSTAIESDRKLTWSKLENIAERRRVNDELSFLAVKDVNMYCDKAYVDGKEADHI